MRIRRCVGLVSAVCALLIAQTATAIEPLTPAPAKGDVVVEPFALDATSFAPAGMSFEPVDNLSYLIPKAWTVDEKLTTGYVKGNIDTEWGSVGVRGNIGVQIQHADQSSRANFFDSTQPAGQEVQPYENGKTYTDYLPSMEVTARPQQEEHQSARTCRSSCYRLIVLLDHRRTRLPS